MDCPRCADQPLKAMRTADCRFHLDACPRCRGVWRDAQELRASLGQPRQAEVVPAYALAGKSTLCPGCRVPLFEYCYPGTQVLVDGCRRCGGTWLDRDDWALIRGTIAADRSVVCPKCQAGQASTTTCERCGLIFAKYRELEAQREQAFRQKSRLLPDLFSDAYGFSVRQRLDWLDILTPLELANRYEVTILAGRNRFGMVREHSRSLFNLVGRFFLGHLRPAVLQFEDESGSHAFTLRKRLRMYFHHLDVCDVDGVVLGTVRRRWHLLRDVYEISDSRGRALIGIRGPIFFLPFTDRHYRFRQGPQDVGSMVKQWRGWLRESFTDADAYRVDVERSLPVREKLLLFGAVFLIDFGRFENNERTE
jgi:Zn-finger nucleic acid-binding protein/uncharacterized protein YxjI